VLGLLQSSSVLSTPSYLAHYCSYVIFYFSLLHVEREKAEGVCEDMTVI
jgi:hypothetical protein